MNTKKISYIVLFFFTFFFELHIDAKTPALTGPAKTIYEKAKSTDRKLPSPEWSYTIEEIDSLYHFPLERNDSITEEELKIRYDRMLHSSFMKSAHTKEILKKLYKLTTYTSKIASYVKKRVYYVNDVQHISVYGSFLYNNIDPDDVDILVIVDSPYSQSTHIDTTLKEMTGEDTTFPKISLQIIDYNTYVKVKNLPETSYLTYTEKLALQHLAVAGSWYLTIYGYEFRYDDPSHLKEHTKLNYLNKSLQSLNAAGARLYKSAYNYLPYESNRVRLRKVVSRILITDFLIPVLDKSFTSSSKPYNNLHEEIRKTAVYDTNKWTKLEKKVQQLYFDKLAELLIISEKYNKLDDISFSNKG